MSQENLNAFIAKVQSDSGLLEQMKNVSEADGAIAIARSAGFEITAGDLVRQQAKIASELSDEELEGVAGGALTPWATLVQYGLMDVGAGGISIGLVLW